MRKGVDYGQYFRKKIVDDNELLELYKPGVRYFRHSRNLIKPVTFIDVQSRVMDKLVAKGGYKLLDQYSLSINRLDFDGETQLNKIFYKKYRKEKVIKKS